MLQKLGLQQKKRKEDGVPLKGESFTEYVVQYVREGSGTRDTVDN